jgi:hypothetical protein
VAVRFKLTVVAVVAFAFLFIVIDPTGWFTFDKVELEADTSATALSTSIVCFATTFRRLLRGMPVATMASRTTAAPPETTGTGSSNKRSTARSGYELKN